LFFFKDDHFCNWNIHIHIWFRLWSSTCLQPDNGSRRDKWNALISIMLLSLSHAHTQFWSLRVTLVPSSLVNDEQLLAKNNVCGLLAESAAGNSNEFILLFWSRPVFFNEFFSKLEKHGFLQICQHFRKKCLFENYFFLMCTCENYQIQKFGVQKKIHLVSIRVRYINPMGNWVKLFAGSDCDCVLESNFCRP
jgi:hypothetical protein